MIRTRESSTFPLLTLETGELLSVYRPTLSVLYSLSRNNHSSLVANMSSEETPNTDLITLTRYDIPNCIKIVFSINANHRHVLSDQLRLGASATGDLTLLLTAIQVTSKFIATNVRKARLINLYVDVAISMPIQDPRKDSPGLVWLERPTFKEKNRKN
jgi:hypothetical protein